MSLSRVFAPLRASRSFLRPSYNALNVFDRDPFFARLAPLINSEMADLQGYNSPPVRIRESPTAYRLEAEIPGFRKDDVSIEVVDSRTLRISGTRYINKPDPEETQGETVDTSKNTDTEATKEPLEADFKDITPVESEDMYSMTGRDKNQEITFSRQWRLPLGVDQDAVKASLDHGILSIVLPKLKSEAARKITIE
jgi:HSP20 family protein